MTLSSELKIIHSKIIDSKKNKTLCSGKLLEKIKKKVKIMLDDMDEKGKYIFVNKDIVYDKFRIRGVNNSLAQKYNEKGDYWNSFHGFFSSIYYLIIAIIFAITIWKKQYKNYKIFVYLLAFLLLSFSIFPIYEKINDYFYNTNRIVQLILSYSFLGFIFLLLNSFTNFVFEIENMEGKRDMYILYSIFGVTSIIVFFRYMVYNYGIKEFVSP
tara:strand:- start:4310 stop:4948 length:639 start_codon:yes stop_codon:yes gene_type:complete